MIMFVHVTHIDDVALVIIFLPQFVELVGSLIRVRASQLSFTRGSDDDFISTFRMLLPLYQADLTICDKHGMNVIHQLITYIDNLRSVEGVDANTQAHLVTVMKDLLSHDGRLLESRDANNRTVFLHLVHSRILAFGPLLALDPPPDVSVVDFDGNNMFHLLLRETSLSPLVYAFTYPTGFWCTRAIGILFHTNKDGLTAVELAAKDKQVNPMKQQMHLLMSAAARAWRESVVPFIMRELDNCMIKDVANICTEYLDGSGRPWQLPTSASLPSPTTTTE